MTFLFILLVSLEKKLNAEIKRRKLLLSSFGVDNVDSYIRALRLIRKIKELESDEENSEEIKKLKKKLSSSYTVNLLLTFFINKFQKCVIKFLIGSSFDVFFAKIVKLICHGFTHVRNSFHIHR